MECYVMISAGDFRKGLTVEIEGNVYTIVDFQHVKPGKGAAFVLTKIKNVMTGAVLERTFNPSDKMPRAHIETKEMQYLYSDGELYYFMDNETYEQLPLNHSQVEDAIMYVKENMNVTVRFFKGRCLLGGAAELCRAGSDPGRPRRAWRYGLPAPRKNAVLETGARINVPLFVNEGGYSAYRYPHGRIYGARLPTRGGKMNTLKEKVATCRAWPKAETG